MTVNEHEGKQNFIVRKSGYFIPYRKECAAGISMIPLLFIFSNLRNMNLYIFFFLKTYN